jgi:hypothetical protein
MHFARSYFWKKHLNKINEEPLNIIIIAFLEKIRIAYHRLSHYLGHDNLYSFPYFLLLSLLIIVSYLAASSPALRLIVGKSNAAVCGILMGLNVGFLFPRCAKNGHRFRGFYPYGSWSFFSSLTECLA